MLDQLVTKSPVYSCSDPVPSLYLTRPASSMPVIACYLHGMSNLAFVTWGPLGTTPHSAAVLFQKLFSVLPSPSPLNSLLSTEGHKKKTQSGGSVVYDPEHVHSDKTKFDPLSQLIRFIILDNLANPLNLSNLTRNGKHCTCLNSRNALIDCKVRGPRVCPEVAAVFNNCSGSCLAEGVPPLTVSSLPTSWCRQSFVREPLSQQRYLPNWAPSGAVKILSGSFQTE